MAGYSGFKWPFILSILFILFHSNNPEGPDTPVYLSVAHTVISKGSLNILPDILVGDYPYQITKTNHAPIHQNIGGVLFILPATALAIVSTYCAKLIPALPARLYDAAYFEGLWIGCISYLLAIGSCILIYRVARCYHSGRGAVAALVACAFGGPLLVYTVIYPCQTNLPAAFLSSLLLYAYHFADLRKNSSWILMGAVWGLGTFVRTEFVVWVLLICFAAAEQRRLGVEWPSIFRKALAAFGGGLLFIIPSIMMRQVLFGDSGSSYTFQFDYSFLSISHLMLFGARNGLFIFWPVFLLSLAGYFWKIRRNPPVYHALFVIVLLETALLGSTVFWSGEFGASFGQRRFLVVYPCLVLFLARLFDLHKKYFYPLGALCFLSLFWALLMHAAYGLRWNFPDYTTGFLMPLHPTGIIPVIGEHYRLFTAEMLKLLFLPKHDDVYWLFPLFALPVAGGWLFLRRFDRQRLLLCTLAGIVLVACVTAIFLAGAGSRGEQVFREIEANNSQYGFLLRNHEIDFEIIGSAVDMVAFFLELDDKENAQYHQDRTISFLEKEAPDQLQRFTQMCAALRLRSSLGWERLVPEQSHYALLDWYSGALAEMAENRQPEDIRKYFR